MKKQINYPALMCITAILFIGLIAYELHRLVNVAIRPVSNISKYHINLPEEFDAIADTTLLRAYKLHDTIFVEFVHNYETTDIYYNDGDTLLPDYVHSDTLIVVSSEFLNWAMKHYDAGGDGDISDILGEGTIPLADYADYVKVMSQTKKILKKTTDSRGLTSVVFTQYNDTMAFDYLTRYEYDSIFRK